MLTNLSRIAVCVALATVTVSLSAQTPADPNKILHVSFEAPDDGFDMVKTSNYYSGSVSQVFFERLLTYDYLARPVSLRPETAQAMPEIKENGKVYIFKIKPGILFAPDAIFKGKPRELVAEDYVYSFKRYFDPANRSPSASFIDGKILGADIAIALAKKSGKFDYDVPIEGLKALDKYTLQITLKQPDYNFSYILAYTAFGAMAREVVEGYGSAIGRHPVGTGPYMLSKYVPRSKIELVANPNYRGFVWNFKSTGTAWDNQLVKDMTGKKMPQVGKVQISIIEEEQSRWLAFQSKQLDFDKLTQNAVEKVLDGEKLKAEFSQQGIGLYRAKEVEVTYTILNQRDPIIGGQSLDKIALRRAIALSFNEAEEIKLLRRGQAVAAEMFVPDGVSGHDPQYRSSIGYDPVLANKLLDKFGYKKGADGYRTLPNGKPLILKKTTESSTSSVIQSEVWKRSLDAVGLRVEFVVSNFADNLKAATQCKLMMWGGAWHADFPEGENFAQLLYGPNAGQGNHSCYRSPAFDALYREAIALPPDQRIPYYQKMSRQMEADGAWVLHDTRIRNWLVRPWVKGLKIHPIINTSWQYLDVVPQK